MTYALLIVQGPEVDATEESQRRWHAFQSASAQIQLKDERSKRLPPGSWLLHLRSDLLTLGMLTAQAARHHFPSHTLFFDKEPDLITT